MTLKSNQSTTYGGARRPVVLALLMAAASLALGKTAAAALTLTIDFPNVPGDPTIVDNGAGDTDSAPGEIVSDTPIAGFGFSINIGQSNSPGSAGGGELQIGSLDIENLNPGPTAATLVIRVSDINFTDPAGPSMGLSSSIGGTFLNAQQGDSMSFQSFADPSNTLDATTVTSGIQLFVKHTTDNPESFNGDAEVPWTRGSTPYSLTNITTVTLSPGASVELNSSGTTLAIASPNLNFPEPASLGLLGFVGAAALRRRRRVV